MFGIAILAFGIFTSYSDIKYGKIKNFTIKAAFIFSFFLYLWLYIFGNVNKLLLTNTAINIMITSAISILLWLNSSWCAADAKLFIAYAFLIPLTTYQLGTIQYFESFGLLVNSFFPFLIFASFKALFQTSAKEKIKLFNKKNLNEISNMAIKLFAVWWISSLLSNIFNITNMLVFYLLIFLIYYLANINKKIVYVIAILRVILDYQTLSKSSFWIIFFAIVFTFGIFKLLVIDLLKEQNTKKISTNKLKKGMVVSQYIVAKLNKYKIDYKPEGISTKDINKIKKSGIKTIIIEKTIPFAPFMFLGAIITLLVKGNIVVWLINLL